MGNAGAHAWLEEGLRLLAEQGAPAVTLERLCARMGLSKGAFYHHFGSMPKFRTRLLGHFEAKYTMAIIDAVEGAGELPAREKLSRVLTEAVKETGPELEMAMRAWANQDPEAMAVQERVDTTRIGYLRQLCEEAGHGRPDRMAKLLYLVLVGGAHVAPPLRPAEKRDMCDLILLLLDQPPARSSSTEAAS